MRNIPNLLSMLRLGTVPILLWLAWAGHAQAFLILIIIAASSDWLDGFIARKFNLTTDVGAKLDSYADAAIYFTLAVAAYLLWPQIFFAEKIFFALMATSIIGPVTTSLIKFKTLTSYHTWLVKVAAAVAVISTLILFLGYSAWPFRIATILCLTAALEQIAITLISDKPASDVQSVWHVYKNIKN